MEFAVPSVFASSCRYERGDDYAPLVPEKLVHDNIVNAGEVRPKPSRVFGQIKDKEL